MGPPDFILEILLVIGAAAIGAAVFQKLRLPIVAGFLVMGAVVGPGGLGLVEGPDRVRALAEFGVALLLFEIGLELPIDALRRAWRMWSLSGALQVSLTVAGVAAAAAAFGASIETAIVMGMLVSLSSTALVMRVLNQRGEVDAPHGRLTVGILLFQDLCLVPFLLVVPILAGEGNGRPVDLALLVLKDLSALAILFAGARFLLPWLLERVASLRSPDLFSLFAFLLAIGSALAAERMGLTLAVGAFIAGLVVSASPYAHQLFAEVVPLRGVLLGIFFTAVGMLFDPDAAAAAWRGILLFVGGVVILKAGIIVFLMAVVLRQGLRVGILIGLGLAQTGEFSFVLAGAAAPAGILDRTWQQIFVAGSVLTLVATPFLVDAAPRIARLLVGSMEGMGLGSHAEAAGEVPSDHVVIVGCGHAGRTLGRVLQASNIPYRSVDQNPRLVREAQARGEPASFGDATRVPILERLGVARARVVCIAINDPGATRRCISIVRSLAPEVVIVARAHYVQELDHLLTVGASKVVAEEFESTIDLFSTVLRVYGIPQHAIARFADLMRMEGYEFTRAAFELPLDPWLSEVLQEISTEWVEVPETLPGEHSILDLRIRSRTGVSILAVARAGATTTNPSPEFRIRAGDSLLVLASPTGLQKIRALLASGDGDLRGPGPRD